MYRFAVSATFEYVTAAGGTLAATMAEITTAVNRVNQIYERDLGIRLQLIANNDLLIDVDGSVGFTNDDALRLVIENQAWVDAQIGSANYDIGHIFSTSGGGLAQIGTVCFDPGKARGATGLSNPSAGKSRLDSACGP